MSERVCSGCPHNTTRACVLFCKEHMVLGAQANECPIRKRDEQIAELVGVADSIPLLVSVHRTPTGKHTHCAYCDNVIDGGDCGNHEHADKEAVVTGHDESCVYKRALKATGRKF